MEKMDLSRGAPPLDTVFMEGILGEAPGTKSPEQLIRENPTMMTYKGSDVAGHNFKGYGPLRETLASKHGVESDQIMVRNGGMDIMSKVLGMLNYRAEKAEETNKRVRVLTEAPTYDRFPINLQIHRMDWVGVPIDSADGLDMERLESELAKGDIDMVYLIDPGQNPSGYNYTPEEREKINALCEKHGTIIMWDRAYENLVYDDKELIYTGLPQEADHVIVSRNYTKEIAAGGVKLGYVVIPKEMVADMNQVLCNEGLNAGSYLSSAIVNNCIEAQEAYLAHINRLREQFAARAKAFVQQIQKSCPDAHLNPNLNSGYFANVDYPGLPSRDVFVEALTEQGLSFCDSSSSYPEEFRHLSTGVLRFPFVLLDEQTTMPDVVSRVTTAYNKVREQSA